jgi:hypothetical protein
MVNTCKYNLFRFEYNHDNVQCISISDLANKANNNRLFVYIGYIFWF